MMHSDQNLAERRQRGLEAIKLQEIEGNPFTPEEIEMFEMFAREGWSEERCRDFILKQIEERSAIDIAA